MRQMMAKLDALRTRTDTEMITLSSLPELVLSCRLQHPQAAQTDSPPFRARKSPTGNSVIHTLLYASSQLRKFSLPIAQYSCGVVLAVEQRSHGSRTVCWRGTHNDKADCLHGYQSTQQLNKRVDFLNLI